MSATIDSERLSPKIDSQELTLGELKVRIEQTIQALTGSGAKDFSGAEDRRIEHPRRGSGCWRPAALSPFATGRCRIFISMW